MPITINPVVQTNAPGTFGIQWDGLIQGTAQPDPETRFALSSGWLDPAETLPMWGGVGITENVPQNQANPPPVNAPGVNQQGMIQRATNVTGGATVKTLTGFSVFDQAYGMINSPQSPVPLAAGYMQVMFYRLGSMARLALKMDPTLAAALYGLPVTEPIGWDFTNQMLIASGAGVTVPGLKILRVYPAGCMTVNYNSGTGFATWNRNDAAALVMI
jgi:hypothetical protein